MEGQQAKKNSEVKNRAERSLQISDRAALRAALADEPTPVHVVLVRRDTEDPETLRLVAEARERGVRVEKGNATDLLRLSDCHPPADVLGLLRRDPGADVESVFASPGCKWLMVGAVYPGNVGAAIRTAEIAGGDAVFVDAELNHDGRRRVLRMSMKAQRFLPVFFQESAASVVERARRAGHRVVGVEDVGSCAPWEVDLAGPVLFVVGGEGEGVAPALLTACDTVVRIPMRGFLPCYNLQAAVAAVATERLRQQDAE
jgi:23S rRNA (guanosine2251-2'-O)-methyltransferase